MSNLYGPRIVTDGLVLHLDAGNRKSYPGSGSTWYDLTNTQNGTLVNTPTYSTQNGGFFTFNGSNQGVNLGTGYESTGDPFAQYNQHFSISYFAKVVSFLSNDSNHYVSNTVFAKSSDPYNDNFEMGYSPAGKIEFYIDDGSNDPASAPESNFTISTGTWHHVCLVYDASIDKVNLYLNGYQNQEFSYTLTGMDQAVGSYVTIGNSRRNRSWFNGSIAALSLYNVSLSSDQAEQNFNALKGRFGL